MVKNYNDTILELTSFYNKNYNPVKKELKYVKDWIEIFTRRIEQKRGRVKLKQINLATEFKATAQNAVDKYKEFKEQIKTYLENLEKEKPNNYDPSSIIESFKYQLADCTTLANEISEFCRLDLFNHFNSSLGDEE